MKYIVGLYGLEIIALIVIAILSWLFFDRRFRKGHGKKVPLGFQATDEIMIDPTTGKKLQVYYNPATGERYYHEEEA